MILGQLRVGARQAKNAPLMVGDAWETKSNRLKARTRHWKGRRGLTVTPNQLESSIRSSRLTALRKLDPWECNQCKNMQHHRCTVGDPCETKSIKLAKIWAQIGKKGKGLDHTQPLSQLSALDSRECNQMYCWCPLWNKIHQTRENLVNAIL